MRLVRTLCSLLIALPVLAAGGAGAAELTSGSRLVPGGGASASDGAGLGLGASGLGDYRVPLLSMGGLSLGAISNQAKVGSLPFTGSRSPLAVGGYVAYGSGSTRLASSLKSDGVSSIADISASSRMGTDSIAALSLGVSRTNAAQFSPNAQQLGASFTDPYRPAGDINLSLSLIRQVTPAFSVGGGVGASRPSGQDSNTPGLTLGAGLGYRF